jgi:hypothetical protein
MRPRTIAGSVALALLLAACGASQHKSTDLARVSGTGTTSTKTDAQAPTRTGPKRAPKHVVAKTTTATTATRTDPTRAPKRVVVKMKPKTTTATTPTRTDPSRAPKRVVVKMKPKTTTATTPTRTDPKRPPTHTTTKPSAPTKTTKTTPTPTVTTPHYTTVNSTTPVGSPNSVPPPDPYSAPAPTGADPTGPNSPMSCLNTTGLANAHMWQSGSWTATDTSQNEPVFIDGPFASHSAAVIDGNSLTPVEYVIAAGNYVVQTTLTNKSPDVLTPIAKCIEG